MLQSDIPILTDAIVNDEYETHAPSAGLEVDAMLADPATGPLRADEPPAPECSAPEPLAGRQPDTENLIAELQTRIASAAFALTEELLHTAFSEMEAKLHQQISARLRSELPELIDSLLRAHLDDDRDL